MSPEHNLSQPALPFVGVLTCHGRVDVSLPSSCSLLCKEIRQVIVHASASVAPLPTT